MIKIFGSLLCYGVLLVGGSMCFAGQGEFGFGVSDSVKATKDINVGSTDELQKDAALLDIIKGVVNYILGILALIALIIVLYGGFRMVTAAGDEDAYNAGFTTLKSAAIGLVIIGVAWFIVSLIFFLITLFAGSAEGTEAWTAE